ncbi:unnamed protein product, partial [Didymodactylos carnosus]
KQQCVDGTDEGHCEQPEFNECQPDEYRCSNGQCIDRISWLDDGKFIDERSRYDKVTSKQNPHTKTTDYCASYRDKNYVCEKDDTKSMWTVDDIGGKEEDAQDLVEFMNKLHPNLKFTYEIENNFELPFLDVK